jgi:hypothetical protein
MQAVETEEFMKLKDVFNHFKVIDVETNNRLSRLFGIKHIRTLPKDTNVTIFMMQEHT